MKGTIVGLALLFTLGGAAKLAAQETQKITFYYYPSSNVYYNVSSGEYWYYDDVRTTWTLVKTLPATIVVEKTPRYPVYYNGTDVWKENAAHVKKYKVKKNGDIKAKKPTRNE